MSQLDRVVHGMAAFNRAAEEEAAARCTGPRCPEEVLALSFTPGAQVMDLVTGEKGTILAGTRTDSLIPHARR